MTCKEIEIAGRSEPLCVDTPRELLDGISRIAREEMGYGNFIVYDKSGPGSHIGQMSPSQLEESFERIMGLSIKPYNEAA